MVLTSCNNNENEELEMAAPSALSIDGGCDTYEIGRTNKSSAWTIVSYPEWSTPIAESGNASDAPKIYFENNGNNAERSGEVVIRYSDGTTSSVKVIQSRSTEDFHMERMQGVGWGIDLTSYMDSRGLTDQIFNKEKCRAYDEYSVSTYDSERSDITVVRGEGISSINDQLSANLNLNVKISAFSGSLSGAFDKTSMKNSKRVFAWMRGLYQQKLVRMSVDSQVAQDEKLFTYDFAKERQKVIDYNGTDSIIGELIDRYGTHYIYEAGLGGFLDYFYSFEITEETIKDSIDAALNISYENKFGIHGHVNLGEDKEFVNSEKIEKFFVRGGDAMSITNIVASGEMNESTVPDWQKTLVDEKKYELVTFNVSCIATLFPDDPDPNKNISGKIRDYITRVMYYGNMAVTTRSSAKKK
jgi:hypothetical protein